MEAVAKLKNIRLSAQKGRLVASLIRGKAVAEAINILQFSPKKGAVLLLGVLRSAIANAEHNVGLDEADLIVKEVLIDRGPFLKRFMARAKGRGARILKPTCHVVLRISSVVGR